MKNGFNLYTLKLLNQRSDLNLYFFDTSRDFFYYCGKQYVNEEKSQQSIFAFPLIFSLTFFQPFEPIERIEPFEQNLPNLTILTNLLIPSSSY